MEPQKRDFCIILDSGDVIDMKNYEIALQVFLGNMDMKGATKGSEDHILFKIYKLLHNYFSYELPDHIKFELLSFEQVVQHPEFFRLIGDVVDATRNRPDTLIEPLFHLFRWSPPMVVQPNSPDPAQEVNNQSVQDDLLRGYQQEYRGNAAADFVNHVVSLTSDIANATEFPYAHIIPVTQSSGTGKSRTLSEVGKTVFAAYVCLRQENVVAWPPSDSDVRRFLVDTSNNDDNGLDTHLRYISFLGAFARHTEHFLIDCNNRGEDPLWSLWSLFHESLDLRTAFWKSVTIDATNIYNEHKKDLPFLPSVKTASPNLSFQPASPRQIQRDAEEKQKRSKALIASVVRLVEAIAKDAFKSLFGTVTALYKQLAQTNPEKKKSASRRLDIPIFLLVVDEANTMDNRYRAFRRVMSELRINGIFAVTMDTNTSVNYFLPSAEEHASFRDLNSHRTLIQPFCDFGFDHQIRRLKGVVSITHRTVESLDWLRKFGRPLWSITRDGHDDDAAVENFVLKLLGSRRIGNVDPTRDHARAVITSRIVTRPVLGSPSAMAVAKSLVTTHLRILEGYSAEYNLYYTHSPSEPVLAIAAASCLYSEPGTLASTIELFRKDFMEGVMERGRAGEVLSQINLCLSKDIANNNIPSWRGLMKPVRLIDHITTLLGSEQWHLPPSSIPALNQCKMAFEHVYVNFTHVEITDDFVVTEEKPQLLCDLYMRHTLLQCCFPQTYIDKLIAGCNLHGNYETEIDRHLDPSDMYAIVVSDKLRAKGVTKVEDQFSRHGVPDSSNPYLCLFLDMGSESKLDTTKTCTQLYVPSDNSPYEVVRDRCLQAEAKLGDKSPNHIIKEAKEARKAFDAWGRYILHIRGIKPATYGWVTRMDQQLSKMNRPTTSATPGFEEAYSRLATSLTSNTQTRSTDQGREMRPLRRLRDRAAPEYSWSTTPVGPTPADSMEVDQLK